MGWANGLYVARSAGSGPDYTLMLRVDLDPHGVNPGYVSADLFLGLLADSIPLDSDEMTARLQFIASFRSPPLPPKNPAAEPNELPVVLASLPADGSSIHLQLKAEMVGQDRFLAFQGTDESGNVPAGPLLFVASYRHEEFRELTLEVDASPGLPTPYKVEFDHPTGKLSFTECFRRAGFRLLRLRDGDSSLLEGDAWDLGDLLSLSRQRSAAAAVPGFWQHGLSLHVYLMIVGRQEDSADTTGAMFDKEDRASAAVFYSSLRDAFGRNQAELDANYLFTAVHEVAHCLNLPHVFDDAHLDGMSTDFATYMNYPQRYTGVGLSPTPPYLGHPDWDNETLLSYRNFWSAFQYTFMPRELLELRHGARKDVLVGGDPLQEEATDYRGDFAGSKTSMIVGGRTGVGLALQLRIRGDRRSGGRNDPARTPIFEFGEPIHVEAQLENLVKRPRPITHRLSVMTGDLQISYQTPDGRFLNYKPPAALCAIPRTPKMLDGDDRTPTPDSCHKDVCLNLGGRGFGFLTPGLYRVRASYRYHDSVLVSNVLELYVRCPSPKTEDLVVPLLNDDVASYFSFRGVYGMSAANERLRERFLNDSGKPKEKINHPLFQYYCACEARLSEKDRIARDPASGTLKRVKASDHDPLFWYRWAFDVNDLNDLKTRRGGATLKKSAFSNVALGKFGMAFGRELKKADPDLAAGWLARLGKALQDRGVPDTIREKISRAVNSPGPDSGTAPANG